MHYVLFYVFYSKSNFSFFKVPVNKIAVFPSSAIEVNIKWKAITHTHLGK